MEEHYLHSRTKFPLSHLGYLSTYSNKENGNLNSETASHIDKNTAKIPKESPSNQVFPSLSLPSVPLSLVL